MFFEKERWVAAIEKGYGKGISKRDLYILTNSNTLMRMADAMMKGEYEVAPPYTAKIPKDKPGEFRTVYINQPIDRVLLSIANDLLFELTPEMVHERCGSYQKGKSCGRIVQGITQEITQVNNNVIGWKSDLSKYFDSVPLQYIDKAFDMVEEKHGHSALIDVLRKYYHSDWFFDENKDLQCSYQSLKQGCAVASWLADVILYHIDDKLATMKGKYHRYSDDMIYIGEDHAKAKQVLEEELAKMDMKLNPKKVEQLTKDKWFKFLGFSIKNTAISFSPTRLKDFQKEIENRTIKRKKTTYTRALNSVNRFMYKGNGEFSWATGVLGVVNVRKDIDELNKFVMDCLRAVITGKKKVGGLGFVKTKADGCVVRGIGKNVKANRQKTGDDLPNYLSIGCMQNAITTRRGVYNALVAQM